MTQSPSSSLPIFGDRLMPFDERSLVNQPLIAWHNYPVLSHQQRLIKSRIIISSTIEEKSQKTNLKLIIKLSKSNFKCDSKDWLIEGNKFRWDVGKWTTRRSTVFFVYKKLVIFSQIFLFVLQQTGQAPLCFWGCFCFFVCYSVIMLINLHDNYVKRMFEISKLFSHSWTVFKGLVFTKRYACTVLGRKNNGYMVNFIFHCFDTRIICKKAYFVS